MSSLSHHRQKIQAQGRGLVISHGLPAPAHWWKPQSWNRLGKLLPAWILPHLELYRPALLAFDQQGRALTFELEKAAPAALPTGMDALSSVVISREVFLRSKSGGVSRGKGKRNWRECVALSDKGSAV